MNGGDRVRAAVESLAARYVLGSVQREQLEALLALVERDPRAPTTVRSPELAVARHLADSLVSLNVDAVRAAETIADVGSGAGFPGLPLAVALTGCHVRLVESLGRKRAFLEEALAELALPNARVVCARAEDWSGGMSANDIVVARAVGPQPVVLEYAAPLLRLGGTLVDWRGRRDAEEERRSARAAAELGLEPVSVERVVPFEGARDHHLHVFSKARITPARFPRRTGMARKRPLGG
jgi:16S rRNA (guanine527-N7)-methyltransferase